MASPVHWDRVDADFGGGGQYSGATLRVANNLYENGFPQNGFEILKRFSKYTDHFPYITGNPWSDKMFQNKFPCVSTLLQELVLRQLFQVYLVLGQMKMEASKLIRLII